MNERYIMKKLLGTAMLLTVSAIIASAPAFADGLVFDPDTYNSTVDVNSAHPYASKPTATRTVNNTAPVTATGNQSVQTQQNNSLQNALFELDSAQVDVRNQLLDAKAKYAEVDNQFKMIKEQRKAQKKVVKDYEKRIKTIESTKEKIRNTMQVE